MSELNYGEWFEQELSDGAFARAADEADLSDWQHELKLDRLRRDEPVRTPPAREERWAA